MIIKINWLTSCFPDTLVRKKRSAEPMYNAYYAANSPQQLSRRSLSFDDIDFDLSDVEVKTSWYVVEYHMMTV